MDCIEAQPTRAGSVFVFPADWGDGHFFASVAGDLGFSELTIAGLLGHSAHDVTQRYVHLDTALIVAVDRVSMEISKMLGCEAPTERPGNAFCEHPDLRPADSPSQAMRSLSSPHYRSISLIGQP